MSNPVGPSVRFGVVPDGDILAPVLTLHIAAVELAHALEADLVARAGALSDHLAAWRGQR